MKMESERDGEIDNETMRRRERASEREQQREKGIIRESTWRAKVGEREIV